MEDSVDPLRDLEIIREELRLKDVATLEKVIEPLKKEVSRDGTAAGCLGSSRMRPRKLSCGSGATRPFCLTDQCLCWG